MYEYVFLACHNENFLCKGLGADSGNATSSPQVFRGKKDKKKCYPWTSLSLSCLAHDNFYSDTLAQSSICSLPAQCSLNFNETQFPKFTAKCTYPTNVTISNFTYTFG